MMTRIEQLAKNIFWKNCTHWIHFEKKIPLWKVTIHNLQHHCGLALPLTVNSFQKKNFWTTLKKDYVKSDQFVHIEILWRRVIHFWSPAVNDRLKRSYFWAVNIEDLWELFEACSCNWNGDLIFFDNFVDSRAKIWVISADSCFLLFESHTCRWKPSVLHPCIQH